VADKYQQESTKVTFRNPKRTNWESYKNDLRVNLEVILQNIHSVHDVELTVEKVEQVIISSELSS
jgi:hypothetical protein